MKSKAVRFIKTVPLIAVSTVLTIAGCGKKSPPISIFPLVNKEDIQIGAGLYKSRCAICHGTTAQGNMPSFAPLENSAIVKGDPLPFASTILYGKGHETKPGGPHFFEQMDDASIARIGNYIKAESKATEIPMRAKIVEKAREIHAAENPQQAPAPTPAPDNNNSMLPEPDEAPLPD